MAASIDPLLPALVLTALVIISVAVVMRLFRQPHVIGYILVGIIIGPFGLGILQDQGLLEHLGSLGIVLLLFFIGMHVSLEKLIAKWRVAVLGTLAQIMITLGATFLFGKLLGWPLNRSILLGFVLSISSTAVILKILEDWRELDTHVGQNALSILLVQDVAIIPMMIIINILGGQGTDLGHIAIQSFGGILIIGTLVWLIYKRKLQIPFKEYLVKDKEMQIFLALLICFGFAMLSGLFGLSTALGAFIAGILVAAIKEEGWIQESLSPFYVVFVAIFFIYVGISLNIDFMVENIWIILQLVFGAFILNTIINAFILRALGDGWRESFYAGSMLAQIGEFSFLLSAVAFQVGMVSIFAHQLIIATISLTLFFSPMWIMAMKRLLKIDVAYVRELRRCLVDRLEKVNK